jgi:hypothetical protein
MSGSVKGRGAGLPTILVYEEAAGFTQYAGAGNLPVAVYDRERAVLEAARRVARARGYDSIRVVFVIETELPELDQLEPGGQNADTGRNHKAQ